ncbi:hypothetical protein FRC06_010051, partial [Ceratobasidium sp. 370]
MNLREIIGIGSSNQESVERDRFIGSFFLSSGHLSERILAWSQSNDRGRLFSMKFHAEWRHKDCPVMGWYDQQCKSSTRFWSIEHRRNVEGLFLHEFLLLKLTDGAICRVERTGEGSRTDAIRSIGCTAHDFIQWFTKSDYDQFSAKCPSVLIAEVDLRQEFDILDVLAICYSIQNTKACRVYTLQRYNCYFLCLTVLTMLTRRVASWETMVTNDEWDSCVSSLLDKLSNLSPDDSKKYPITRLCALLEPDNPQPGRFIFDALRAHLTSQAGALTSYSQAMKKTLWRTAWDSLLFNSLITSLQPTVSTILEDESHCGTLFRRTIHTHRWDAAAEIRSDNVLASHYAEALAKPIALEHVRRLGICRKLSRMREMEQPISFGNRVCSRLAGSFGGALFALIPFSLLAKTKIGNDNDYITFITFSHMARASKLKIGSAQFSALILDSLDGTNTQRSTFDEAADGPNNLTVNTLSAVLDGLAAKGTLGPSKISLVMANLLDRSDVIALLASLITSVDLGRALRATQEAHQTEIYLLVAPQDGPKPSKTSITPANFQETYIQQRIHAHAKRVDAHQLAAAPLVSEDIGYTMAK